MPDLSNSYIGGNYRRALDSFSRFGTRKLVYYVITVYGLEDDTINPLYDLENTYQGEGQSYPSEYIEAPGSIIEAIQRGVQLVAEPYAYGDWDTYGEGPNYTDLTITAIVASDTVDDDAEQGDVVPRNPNSYTVESAIADAIANFTNDGVEVRRALLIADAIDTGAYALARTRGGSEAHQARMAAHIAAGKNAFKRNG